MTFEFKTQYLQAIRRRYFNSTKKGKSQILDELCKITGYSRKHAIRILAEGHVTGKKNSGRTIAYYKDARFHLKKIWHIMGRICALKRWLQHFLCGLSFIRDQILQLLSNKKYSQ